MINLVVTKGHNKLYAAQGHKRFLAGTKDQPNIYYCPKSQKNNTNQCLKPNQQ